MRCMLWSEMIKNYLIDNDNYYCVLSFGILWLYIWKMIYFYKKIFYSVFLWIFGLLLILGVSLSIYVKFEMKFLFVNIVEVGFEYYDFKIKEFVFKDL